MGKGIPIPIRQMSIVQLTIARCREAIRQHNLLPPEGGRKTNNIRARVSAGVRNSINLSVSVSVSAAERQWR